jgi:3-oxoadipate enol-lactonase
VFSKGAQAAVPTVEHAGAEIWWSDVGSGPPLLLIQGLGYPSDAWWRLVPGLSASFRVLLFDNRGVGRTGVPDAAFSIETMADDAAAVIRAAGETSAHVVGASMGGLIAQEMALRHPALVRSLVLGCTSPGGTDAIPSEAAAQGFLQSRTDMTPREAAEASVPLVYADSTPRQMVAEDIDVRMKIPTGAAGYGAQLGAVLAYRGALSRLAELDAPTLVVHGTEDRLVPPENAKLLADAIRGARLEWLDGAGHVFTTDRVDETLDLVTRFVADQEDAYQGHRERTDR